MSVWSSAEGGDVSWWPQNQPGAWPERVNRRRTGGPRQQRGEPPRGATHPTQPLGSQWAFHEE